MRRNTWERTSAGYPTMSWRPWPGACSRRYKHISRVRRASGSLRRGRRSNKPQSARPRQQVNKEMRTHRKRCVRIFIKRFFSSVGLSAWRWACAVLRCESMWFRNSQRKQQTRTPRQSALGSDLLRLVRLKGLEPTRIAAREPKSRMSTNSITGAYSVLRSPTER